MAEEKTTQTAGTVLNRLGGMGTFYNPNQQAIANAVSSGSLSSADVRTLTGFQLGKLGSKGYMGLYPNVFGGGAFQQFRVQSREEIEIAALRELEYSFIGTGMEIYRTMIANRISSLTKKSRERDFPLPNWMRPLLGLPPLAEEEDMEWRGRQGSRGRERMEERKQTPTISAEEARGLKLAPLGAQTELSVDQQKYLSSFIAWQKAGTPSGMQGASTNMLQRMAQSQGDYWTEFQRKSQSMFPSSQRLGVQKRIASQ